MSYRRLSFMSTHQLDRGTRAAQPRIDFARVEQVEPTAPQIREAVLTYEPVESGLRSEPQVVDGLPGSAVRTARLLREIVTLVASLSARLDALESHADTASGATGNNAD